MAMQYQLSSENQAADGLRRLYLMNPNFVGYPDDHAGHALSSLLTAHESLSSQPLAQDLCRPSEGLIQAVPHRSQYSLWGLVDNQNQPHGLSLNLPYGHRQELQSTTGMAPTWNRASSTENAIMGSKYVRAAQELLDEVASVVGKVAMNSGRKKKAKQVVDAKTEDGPAGVGGWDRGCNKGSGAEFTAAQRQEILTKKAKLSSMLDEVDQRCKEYHQQMQIIISSFEEVAGSGSARSYTEVALRAILRQFRCLRAAILGQIKGLNQRVGVVEEVQHGSRLRFVDHHLRQQQALHQMGMMMSNSSTAAWRPQRGLPERAVAVLRAWLFEHFLHPYPKDSDKRMLAKQAGLTRSQVSNWFINARVRLWKPMVEEMYLEEIKNQEQQPTPLEVPHHTTLNHHSPLPHSDPKTHTPSFLDDAGNTLRNPKTTGPSSLQSRPHFANLITFLDHTSKKLHQDTSPVGMVSVRKSGTVANPAGFEAYGGISQRNPDQSLPTGFPGINGFSLSLGLPPLETSPREQQHGFVSARNFNFVTSMDGGGDRINRVMNQGDSRIGSCEILDFQDRRRFQAQVVLPDFVA